MVVFPRILVVGLALGPALLVRAVRAGSSRSKF